MERLNNDQISQRIIATNSDLKRYLNLAPSFKLTPPQSKPKNSCYNASMQPDQLSRPKLRP
ncbi:hypothetical protein SAMN02746098_03256 [Desulfosporosinus lacus DSM 15449]|uniref:Uncharacterized protein n=1 Tax=Desulfosporosinus lacus DSM 15449 TaxID=1121420 RepID=A0A1M5ZHP3_9FIRM|nr:hypothetical protein SAMN02746098_03256 [Desulfosporosinus lacus DSM 15449]